MAARRGRKKFLAFSEHRAETEGAEFRRFRRRRRAGVRDRAAFERQKDHVQSLYDNLEVVHSFIDANGQIFDCVPADQQPALRRSNVQLSRPPTPPRLPETIRPPAASPAPLRPGRRDRFGNQMQCPPGTVPIRRVTLEELTRFETLDDYLRKPSLPRGFQLPIAPEVVSEQPHAYAFQDIANVGAHTILSVWSPAVAGDQVFSLAQQWCVGSSPAVVQTVEAGWQVYPRMYGHAKPVLFVFSTADNYQHGGYDYQYFVQVSASHPLGIAFETTSVADGPQVEVELSFLLEQGKWWLFVNGIDEQHAIGYFPASLFGGGPLATGASRIEFGGETAGNGSFPPMGSGAFAAAGQNQAACQRGIHYFSPAGDMRAAALATKEEWHTVYTINMLAAAGGDSVIYFGGPGGVRGPAA